MFPPVLILQESRIQSGPIFGGQANLPPITLTPVKLELRALYNSLLSVIRKIKKGLDIPIPGISSPSKFCKAMSE